MQPTILADVTPGMQVVREEIFGPVLVATPFDDLDEAVRLANDSIYGLGASIWSNDLRQVMDLVPRIKAGTVWVNAHNLLDPSMPFGGFKQSGIGREMGHAAIEAYTENKSVCIAYDIDEIGVSRFVRLFRCPPRQPLFDTLRLPAERGTPARPAGRLAPGRA